MFLNDLRFACRQLYKNPAYALAVILTLALGIGVNTAVFSMVDGFILRRLPYPQPDRIASLVVHQEGTSQRSGKAFDDDDDSFTGESWQILKNNITGVIFASYGGTSGVNLKAGADAGNAVRYVHETRVSAHYFDVLGIPLYLGRSFSEQEDVPHGPPVVVLSYALWQSTFHGDPNLIGKSIDLKGEPYTVVGILPKAGITPVNSNALTPTGADLFTPLQPAPMGECGGNNCGIMVRLKPGATWQQVNMQLSHVRLPFFSEIETKYHGHAWIFARPLQRELAGDMRDEVSALMLAVSFILLIACANLAGLALVRISRRTPEIATRLALGATRFDVLRQLWTESLVLALAGAGAGLFFAVLILSGLRGFLPDWMIPIGGFHLDARVLAFTFGVSLITSLFFGALPALQTRRVDLRSSIAAGSQAVVGGTGRTRQWLIGAEVALTVILLAAAGLLVRTLVHLETLPAGFDPTNVMTAKASLDDARYHDAAAFQSLLQKSVAAMRQIPGVKDAAVGLSVPYERGLNWPITIKDGENAGKGTGSSLAYITPDYFSVLRIPILAGRVFTDSDTTTSQPVAVVNTSFAKQFYGEASPIDRHFTLGIEKLSDNITYTIVGVVSEVAKRPGMQQDAPISHEPVFYLADTQTPQGVVNGAHVWFQPSWIVRTGGPIAGLTESMQHALADADPGLPFSGFYAMQQILDQELQMQRIQVLLLTVLGVLALVLSAIGIYSLVSNLVVQRTREIGIRIALGSTIQEAMVHVGSSGLISAGIGLAAGVGFSFVAMRALASEIYGVKTYDPITFGAVVLVLALIAIVASFLPTLRISRIQPADTLRAE
ncbi:ABC transporter permease [Alloacidobacterium sp.]|uniref:ABC transporter permease n=1 Tax=Alloacidobacterium sp. TaxID=2951999 RepID=UPI002D4AE175|nr:ABC transporter permease [Alloacidobacterium sp.]HYK36727.1 ABC transporter permease [Alloacidobacterium sp.]